MLPVLITELVLLGFFVAVILRIFAGKDAPWHVLFTVWLSWTGALSILIMVPVDVMQVYISRCQNDPSSCRGGSDPSAISSVEGFLEVDLFLRYGWSTVYWLCQVMGWVVLTLQQAYVDAGQFSYFGRIKQAVKENLVIIGLGSVIATGLVIYLAAAQGLGLDGIVPVLMAMSNAFGLTMIVLLMGYGLVELPRKLWKRAFPKQALRLAQLDVVELEEKVHKANCELDDILRQISKINTAGRITPSMEEDICKLLERVDEDLPAVSGERDIDLFELKLKDLEAIHSKLIKARRILKKAKARFHRRCRHAFFLEDVLNCEDSPKMKVLSDIRPELDGPLGNAWQRISWVWLIWIRPYAEALLSIICALLSLAVVLSELSTLPALEKAMPSVYGGSVFLILLQSVSARAGLVQFFSALCLTYMCIAVYFTLVRLKVFNVYEVVPKHTDGSSLAVNAYFVTRLVPALCYNYLALIRETHESIEINDGSDRYLTVFEQQFSQMGKVPFLGTSYNIYLPPIILVITLLTLSNCYTKAARFFHLTRFQLSEEHTDIQIKDGQATLARERRHASRLMRASTSQQKLLSSLEDDGDETNSAQVAAGNNSGRSNSHSRPSVSTVSSITQTMQRVKHAVKSKAKGRSSRASMQELKTQPSASRPKIDQGMWKQMEEEIDNI